MESYGNEMVQNFEIVPCEFDKAMVKYCETDTFACLACNTKLMTGSVPAKDHALSSKHQRKMSDFDFNLVSNALAAAIEAVPKTLKISTEHLDTSSDSPVPYQVTPLKKKMTVDTEASRIAKLVAIGELSVIKPGMEFMCIVCNISICGIKNVTAHISGRSHLKAKSTNHGEYVAGNTEEPQSKKLKIGLVSRNITTTPIGSIAVNNVPQVKKLVNSPVVVHNTQIKKLVNSPVSVPNIQIKKSVNSPVVVPNIQIKKSVNSPVVVSNIQIKKFTRLPVNSIDSTNSKVAINRTNGVSLANKLATKVEEKIVKTSEPIKKPNGNDTNGKVNSRAPISFEDGKKSDLGRKIMLRKPSSELNENKNGNGKIINSKTPDAPPKKSPIRVQPDNSPGLNKPFNKCELRQVISTRESRNNTMDSNAETESLISIEADDILEELDYDELMPDSFHDDSVQVLQDHSSKPAVIEKEKEKKSLNSSDIVFVTEVLKEPTVTVSKNESKSLQDIQANPYIQTIADNYFKCLVCHIYVTGLVVAVSHVQGKKHKAVIEKMPAEGTGQTKTAVNTTVSNNIQTKQNLPQQSQIQTPKSAANNRIIIDTPKSRSNVLGRLFAPGTVSTPIGFPKPSPPPGNPQHRPRGGRGGPGARLGGYAAPGGMPGMPLMPYPGRSFTEDNFQGEGFYDHNPPLIQMTSPMPLMGHPQMGHPQMNQMSPMNNMRMNPHMNQQMNNQMNFGGSPYMGGQMRGNFRGWGGRGHNRGGGFVQNHYNDQGSSQEQNSTAFGRAAATGDSHPKFNRFKRRNRSDSESSENSNGGEYREESDPTVGISGGLSVRLGPKMT